MAIKIVAEINHVAKNVNGMHFYLTLNVDDVQRGFDTGDFAPGVGWATIQAAIIQAIKDFAPVEMGVTFGAGDTVLLLYPNFVVA